MTFEQWLEKEYPQTFENKDTHGMKDWVEFAKVAFEAGQETKSDYLVSFVEYLEDVKAMDVVKIEQSDWGDSQDTIHYPSTHEIVEFSKEFVELLK